MSAITQGLSKIGHGFARAAHGMLVKRHSARMQGRDACKRAVCHWHNPFPRNTVEHQAWSEGWDEFLEERTGLAVAAE